MGFLDDYDKFSNESDKKYLLDPEEQDQECSLLERVTNKMQDILKEISDNCKIENKNEVYKGFEILSNFSKVIPEEISILCNNPDLTEDEKFIKYQEIENSIKYEQEDEFENLDDNYDETDMTEGFNNDSDSSEW